MAAASSGLPQRQPSNLVEKSFAFAPDREYPTTLSKVVITSSKARSASGIPPRGLRREARWRGAARGTSASCAADRSIDALALFLSPSLSAILDEIVAPSE